MKTRTSFLVMFMILTYYSSKCQTYYPLVQTNKVWTISYYFIVYHDPHYVTCSTPLYIPDIHDDSFVIYPNPVLDNLYINSNFKNTMILKLTDILGEVKWQTSLSSGENVINLSNCNKGIYILEIYSTSQNIDVRRKIIKN